MNHSRKSNFVEKLGGRGLYRYPKSETSLGSCIYDRYVNDSSERERQKCCGKSEVEKEEENDWDLGVGKKVGVYLVNAVRRYKESSLIVL